MNQAQLLDCTLRDGAYLIDKQFGDAAIHGIIRGLVAAKVDYVEMGFFQDEGFGEGKTVFRNSADAARFVPRDRGTSEFAVLVDYSRFDIRNLDPRREDSIDAIRACFFKHERDGILDYCRRIRELGYKLFVQPVDILGYSHGELLELIRWVNTVEPYCVSIVDTFGSMYEEDLQCVYSLIDRNLAPNVKIGFHSHNNMQLSNALSQAFLRMAKGKRQVIVDGTLSGMGRGAGNAPTELVARYMVSRLGCSYHMDALLDLIDTYMDSFRSRCSWGYTTPYFLGGCYSAHANNITYLTGKQGIRSRDICRILSRIDPSYRKRYDYALLERTYQEYMESDLEK